MPERHQWRRSDTLIVNFKQISHSSGVSIVDFEQVNAGSVCSVIAEWMVKNLDVIFFP